MVLLRVDYFVLGWIRDRGFVVLAVRSGQPRGDYGGEASAAANFCGKAGDVPDVFD
jgi:hypothetical protein